MWRCGYGWNWECKKKFRSVFEENFDCDVLMWVVVNDDKSYSILFYFNCYLWNNVNIVDYFRWKLINIFKVIIIMVFYGVIV